MFAPTLPLEALRTIYSYAATDLEGEKPKCREPESPNRMQISLIDISRAYFNAKCDPAKPTFVSLPTEDSQYQSTCGQLLKHMYGTQAAADGWQQRTPRGLTGGEKFVCGQTREAQSTQRRREKLQWHELQNAREDVLRQGEQRERHRRQESA